VRSTWERGRQLWRRQHLEVDGALVKQIYNFLFSAQDFSRNTTAERPEEGSQGWSTQRSGVRNPWIKEVLKLVALKGRQKWLIVEGAVRQSISKYSNLAQLQTTRLLNPCSVALRGLVVVIQTDPGLAHSAPLRAPPLAHEYRNLVVASSRAVKSRTNSLTSFNLSSLTLNTRLKISLLLIRLVNSYICVGSGMITDKSVSHCAA
jgi:hypothetical protein